MARDIEEFLRQAAQRRQQKLRQKQQQPARPVQPVPQQRPRQPAPLRARPPVRQVEPEIHIIEAEPVAPARESIGNVATQINTQGIVEHAEHLGDRIEQAASRVDQRIHDKFDHRVGHLKVDQLATDVTTGIDQRDEVSPIAQDLLRAFSNPKSVRQAILLTEILNRPNFD